MPLHSHHGYASSRSPDPTPSDSADVPRLCHPCLPPSPVSPGSGWGQRLRQTREESGALRNYRTRAVLYAEDGAASLETTAVGTLLADLYFEAPQLVADLDRADQGGHGAGVVGARGRGAEAGLLFDQ